MPEKSFIDQIDGLGLPKRNHSRRYISVREKLRCRLSFQGKSITADILDLSVFGLALSISTRAASVLPPPQATVQLSFDPHKATQFTMTATISHLERLGGNHHNLLRLGVKFARKSVPSLQQLRSVKHQDSIDLDTLELRGHYIDPSFFAEICILKFTCIHATGVEISLDNSTHGLIPHQTVQIVAALPGFGHITFSGRADDNVIYRDNQQTRVWIHYTEDGESFRSAIAAILLAMAPQTEVAQIKKLQPRANFGCPFLTAQNSLNTENFHTHKVILSTALESTHMRWENYFAGNRPIGRAKYGFFTGKIWADATQNPAGKYLQQRPSLGILVLEMAQGLQVEDFQLAMIRRWIQIAVNEQMGILWLVVPPAQQSSWQGFGFVLLEQPNPQWQLMYLPIKMILTHQGKLLSKANWQKWYQPLNIYYRNKIKQLKNMAS
ncbi:MAG: PilZ domain-containing protein [Zetaproteobacteria bacterium]|nr:PilZ domain-containing protein [Zetaproteobacteria bacterium]